jgi:REP element-mobilizing transposase RayT
MGYRELRAGRRSINGQCYLITFHTVGRRRLFADNGVAMIACRAMTAARAWPASTLMAWVLMPDHWHGLMELGDESLSVCIGRLKAVSSRQLRHCGLAAAVWAPGFHDRALRESDNVVAAARYVVMNPVRAGLASRAGRYPFWDVAWLR